jgi:hypothetical protein
LFIVSPPPVDNFGKLPAPGAQTVLVARRDMAATGSDKFTGQQQEILMPDDHTVYFIFFSD